MPALTMSGPFCHFTFEAYALADFGAFNSVKALLFELPADLLHFLSHIHLPFSCGFAHSAPSFALYIKGKAQRVTAEPLNV